MSKRNKDRRIVSALDEGLPGVSALQRGRNTKIGIVATAVFVLLTVGVFAKHGWFPSTDPMSGRTTGWFGKELAKNASSSWNPLAAPLPTPTPQLSKEYVYAGSRLLAVVDANAQEAPPADLAIWRPTTGGWWVLGGQFSAQVNQNWGTVHDRPVEGDYDGDGKTDFAVWRKEDSSNGAGDAGTWYFIDSSTSTTRQYAFGSAGDTPAQADYDGDGKTDAALFRPSNGNWYIDPSSSATNTQFQFGLSTDTVAPADYDGDGKADIAVWRSSTQTFYSINSSNNSLVTLGLGQSGDKIVSSDYDGDGKADYAVFNSSSGYWNIRKSSTGSILSPIQWGISGDEPVENDYDGDGKTDIATWRDSNGHWYIQQSASSNSLREVGWGVSGDIPVPALYRR